MLSTIVTTKEELEQIVALSHKNQRANVSAEEKKEEGFISWHYSLELLEKMHALHPNVIVKDGDKVIAYALVALKEALHFHNDLKHMISFIDGVLYNGKPLSDYKYYVMGQICIDKDYRGKGVFEMLYKKHKEIFEKEYDFIETEISASNTRSMRAHEKVGFKTIYTYTDASDEWNVVIWDWQ